MRGTAGHGAVAEFIVVAARRLNGLGNLSRRAVRVHLAKGEGGEGDACAGRRVPGPRSPRLGR